MIRQFHEFFNLIFGGFLTFGTTVCRPHKAYYRMVKVLEYFLYRFFYDKSTIICPFLQVVANRVFSNLEYSSLFYFELIIDVGR